MMDSLTTTIRLHQLVIERIGSRAKLPAIDDLCNFCNIHDPFWNLYSS